MNSRLEKAERMYEEQFEKRYGKKTIIKFNGEPTEEVSSLIIKCNGDTFIITEHRKEGATDKAIMEYGDKK